MSALQLSPAESFPIVHVIGNHTDSTTYYVRAVIRDATTDAVLDTVDLTDRGDRRFSKLWKVSYDNVMARGRFIVITTTVYTDSGYTTKSENYAEEANEYVIQERFDQSKYFGGGSGGKFDYEKLRELVQKEVKKIEIPKPQKITIPEPLEVDDIIVPIQNFVRRTVASEVKKIPKPLKQKETDLTPVLGSVDAVRRYVQSQPNFEKTDLQPLLSQIQAGLKRIERIVTEEIGKENNRSFTLTANAENQVSEKDTYMKRLRAKYKV